MSSLLLGLLLKLVGLWAGRKKFMHVLEMNSGNLPDQIIIGVDFTALKINGENI